MIRMLRVAGLIPIVVLLAGCNTSEDAVSAGLPPLKATSAAPASSPAGASGILFRDVTDSTGIGFVHRSGMDAMKHFPASLGGGVTMFDYDGDGKLDLYFCSERKFPVGPPDPDAMGNKLYRNLGGFKFEDVTAKAGVGYKGYCHGAAVGDVDGNGHPDLYLTNYGGNVLYLNNGDGTFRDATKGCGAEVGVWSSGGAFLDYDNDGKLDLYVSCYGQWTEDGPHEYCGDAKRDMRIICSPFSIKPQRHFLFRGRGDGTFEDRTKAAGILRWDGRGLGIISADVNGDGKTDLYIANDGCPNFLFLNRGDGTFEDVTESSGASTDGSGAVQGSMGAEIQDMDGDGKPELFVTNFRGQYNTLYQNLDGRNFQDISSRAGIVKDSLAYVGWGCGLADFDNDGLPDMFVVNGEVDDNLRSFGQEIDYDEPTVVWRNLGRMRFSRVTNPGPYFAANHPSRGAAFGDLDDDGDLDVVISNMDRKPAVLVNESPQGTWIRFALKGTTVHREALGATVEVHAGGKLFQRMIRGGDSYLSVNDRRALIGLGTMTKVDRVDVIWPGGRKTSLDSPVVGKTHTITEPPGGAPR